MVMIVRKRWLAFGLPALVILTSIILGVSPFLQKHPEIAIGITYDLTILSPLIFLVLSKRSGLPMYFAVPLFVIGILVASSLLPYSSQNHLNFIKSCALPVVELIILFLLAKKSHQVYQTFKLHHSAKTDFLAIAKLSANELFGTSRFSSFLGSEIAMVYYAFFKWRGKKLAENEFTSYKENASIALSMALIMVVLIETYAFHVLLLKWSAIVAWLFTATSIYALFVIMAHTKALLFRPSVITEKNIVLRNGLIADINVEVSEIEKVRFCTQEIRFDGKSIGNLGLSKESSNHNIAIFFKSSQRIEKAYGFTEECDILLVHIDDKLNFLETIKKILV